jgi:predicted nucleotidyltransferase
MQSGTKSLSELLQQRLASSNQQARQYVDQASEVIVFGSMSAGLERPDSDMDVLCVGGREYKLKSRLLDLIVVPLDLTRNQSWLQSELATHVCKYGTWIKGTPLWKGDVRIGLNAVEEKHRRVSAFMRSLQNSWFKLEECFRVKYSVKLRRETQRLLLLEQNVAIPPTRILDYAWPSVAGKSYDVCHRLRQLATTAHDSFVDDLLGRVQAHLEANQVPLERLPRTSRDIHFTPSLSISPFGA